MGIVSRAIESLQRKMVVLTGVNYFVDVTANGELWTTVTERESDVWVQYTATFNGDTYVILASLANAAFPHKLQGQTGTRLDGTSIYYAIDLAASTKATLKFGVITRIDETDADIKYWGGIPFETGATKEILVQPLRGVPSQVKLDFDGSGVLQHGLTNVQEVDVAAVNTGLTLDGPGGAIAPGLGDIIIKYDHTGGSSIVALFLFYHNTN